MSLFGHPKEEGPPYSKDTNREHTHENSRAEILGIPED